MNVPGNSVNDTGERMNGGAVIEYKSPENDAILHRRDDKRAHVRVTPSPPTCMAEDNPKTPSPTRGRLYVFITPTHYHHIAHVRWSKTRPWYAISWEKTWWGMIQKYATYALRNWLQLERWEAGTAVPCTWDRDVEHHSEEIGVEDGTIESRTSWDTSSPLPLPLFAMMVV